MIDDSIQTGTPIALAFVDQPTESHRVEVGKHLTFVREVAGYGTPVVVEKRSDGTLLVFLNAVGKAKLGPLQMADTPYLQVEAEPITEKTDMDAAHLPQLLTLQKLLSSWVYKNIPAPEVREQFLEQLRTPEEIVSACASFLLQDPDWQQAVLEENTLHAKISLLNGLLASGKVV